MKRIVFDNLNRVEEALNHYQSHECSRCGGFLEMNIDPLDVIVEDRIMHFLSIPVLKCVKCEKSHLSEFAKIMIHGCCKVMIQNDKFEGEFNSSGYRKRYNYCIEKDFIYDHRDYESIPGLCYDEEHSEEGFLTPV